MILFDIDESFRDVYRVGSKVRYMMCLLGFFRFEWVYLLHDCVIICLKKEIQKKMILTANGKSHENNYILPVCWLDFSDDMVYYGGE